MSVVTAFLLAVLMLAAVLAYRRRRDQWYAVVAAVAALGVSIRAVLGVRPEVSIDLVDLIVLILVVVVAAEALGLPMPLASRLGIGLRSHEWDDRQLTSLLRPLNEMIHVQPSPRDGAGYESWRRAFLHKAERRLARLRRLHAPTERWAGVAAAYADIYDLIADLYRTGDSPEKRATITARSSNVDRERELLRAEHRAKATTILHQSRMARLLRSPPTATRVVRGPPDDPLTG